MITIFNRRRLMTDTNSGVLVQARDRLMAESIVSELHSIRSQSGRELQREAAVHARFNLPAGTASGGTQFIYYLYVGRKDFARAKELLKI